MYIPKTQVIFVHHSNEYNMYVVFGLHMRVKFCQLKAKLGRIWSGCFSVILRVTQARVILTTPCMFAGSGMRR